jgi:hypothetical protein
MISKHGIAHCVNLFLQYFPLSGTIGPNERYVFAGFIVKTA